MSDELKKHYEEPKFEIVELDDNTVQTGPFNLSSPKLFAGTGTQPSEEVM